MNDDSMKKMRLDRRLVGRRGWINSKELAKVIEDLPDVAAKATTLGEASDQAAGETDRAATAEPAFEMPNSPESPRPE